MNNTSRCVYKHNHEQFFNFITIFWNAWLSNYKQNPKLDGNRLSSYILDSPMNILLEDDLRYLSKLTTEIDMVLLHATYYLYYSLSMNVDIKFKSLRQLYICCFLVAAKYIDEKGFPMMFICSEMDENFYDLKHLEINILKSLDYKMRIKANKIEKMYDDMFSELETLCKNRSVNMNDILKKLRTTASTLQRVEERMCKDNKESYPVVTNGTQQLRAYYHLYRALIW